MNHLLNDRNVNGSSGSGPVNGLARSGRHIGLESIIK